MEFEIQTREREEEEEDVGAEKGGAMRGGEKKHFLIFFLRLGSGAHSLSHNVRFYFFNPQLCANQ